jgi:hypothetical protein
MSDIATPPPDARTSRHRSPIGAPDRDVRDRLGEALRRHLHGLMRPLWSDMNDVDRELWHVTAESFVEIAESCGPKIEVGP